MSSIAGKSGGGGSAGIIPETGTGPIKISAFPAASTNMANTVDIVTGLQGGANINFTKRQLLTGQTLSSGEPMYLGGGAATNSTGGPLYLFGGNGAGSGGYGGDIYMYSGNGSGSGNGGGFIGACGHGGETGNGGGMVFRGGGGGGTSGNGGQCAFHGGNGSGSGEGGHVRFFGGNGTTYGGSVFLVPGNGTPPGDLKIDMSYTGNIKIYGVKTTDPSVTSAIWASNDVLVRSGIGNFSGTITSASLATKTITVVHGIITSFA